LDPHTAASVERLVRDALSLAARKEATAAGQLPANFWSSVREMLGPEPFERPAQGELEKREDW
jgi:hypothetical protein